VWRCLQTSLQVRGVQFDWLCITRCICSCEGLLCMVISAANQQRLQLQA
jgi:hypothetical protein